MAPASRHRVSACAPRFTVPAQRRSAVLRVQIPPHPRIASDHSRRRFVENHEVSSADVRRSGDSFYNAGGILNSLRDLHDFSVTLPSSVTPAVLLIGLDPWWFNEQVAPAFSFADEIAKGAGFSFDEHVMALRWLFINPQVAAHQARLALRPDDNRAIGIAARETGGGFRFDGSHKSRLPTPRTEQEWAFVDRETPPVIERVRSGTGNFPPADQPFTGPRGVARRGSRRISDQTRVGHRLSATVFVRSARAARVRSAASILLGRLPARDPELFRKHGFPLFDASATASVGLDDRAMSDGFHAEETFQARVVRALLQDERIERRCRERRPRLTAPSRRPERTIGSRILVGERISS